MTIRNLNEEVKRTLRIRAASHGRSMEAEARLLLGQILTSGLPHEEEVKQPRIRGKWKGKFTTDEILSLTRDVQRFQTYFPAVQLISPPDEA